ncbi:MAG: hypothetical protein WC478_02525 [Candidatus Omnitrophota bacterium]
MEKTCRVTVVCMGLLMGIGSPGAFAQLDLVRAPEKLEAGALEKEAGPFGNDRGQQEEILRTRLEYRAQGLRDPFQPFVQESKPEVTPEVKVVEKPLPSLAVQGLVWGGAFPQAIINNKVVRVGETIEGAQVTLIDKNGVTVLFADREYKLSPPAATGPQRKEKKIIKEVS